MTSTDALTVPPWTERLGGQHLASWPMFLWCAPVPIVGFTIAGLTRQPDVDFAQALSSFGVVITACGVVALLMVMFRETVLRHRFERPVRPIVALACLGSGGTIFAVCFIGGSRLIGLGAVPNPIVTVIVFTGLAAWWGAVMVLLLDSRERIDRVRSEVIEAAVHAEVAAVEQADLSRVLRDYLDARVDDEFREVRARLDVALASTEASARSGIWMTVPEDLRVTARSSVRELSAELWNSAEVEYPRVSVMSILPTVVRTQPLQPLAVASLVVLVTLGGTIERFGASRGMVVAALGALGVLIVLSLGNLVIRRRPAWTSAVYAAVIGLLSCGSLASSAATGQQVTGSLVVLTLLVTVVLILATSAFGAVTQVNADVLRRLSQRIDAATVAALTRQRQLAVIARQAAQVLHGQVQARLIACAAAMDRAVSIDDGASFTSALRQARDILEQPIALPPQATSTAELVGQLAQQWEGIVTISAHDVIDIDDTPLLQAVTLVVDEAITNAFRHGNADAVVIGISRTGGQVRITVDDNGSGPAGESVPGTGSALLTHVAGSRWSLSGNSPLGGGRLEVTLGAERVTTPAPR